MLKLPSIIAIVLSSTFALTALAADLAATPGIDKRQAEQEKRIQEGKASGQLTDKEAAKLERGQAKVEKMEQKAKADGVVTDKERARITHAQNQQSKKIYREKHDRQHK